MAEKERERMTANYTHTQCNPHTLSTAEPFYDYSEVRWVTLRGTEEWISQGIET